LARASIISGEYFRTDHVTQILFWACLRPCELPGACLLFLSYGWLFPPIGGALGGHGAEQLCARASINSQAMRPNGLRALTHLKSRASVHGKVCDLGPPCPFARFGRGAAALGGRQRNTGAAGLRQSDRDGLLRRLSAMLTLANVMHLFTHKFACLRAGRLSFFFIVTRAFDNFFFWHVDLSIRKM
jgi:hypothetical protein